jgi:nitrogen regulatory protein PII-like uncharacterized protein
MKIKLVLFFLSLSFNSCTKDAEILNKEKTLALDPNNLSKIPVNDKSSNVFLLSQIHLEENENPLFIHLNYFDSDPNYLFVNSLNDPTLDLALEFENEGPNGVGGVTEFYFHSFDSIFLVDRYRYLVSLADSSGLVKKSYRLKNSDSNRPDAESVLPWSTPKSRIFLRGKFLYIPTLPDTDPFKSQYKKKNLLLKLDLETGDYTTLLGYPEWYQDGNFWGGQDHILPSISPMEDQNKLLISLPLVDSVYLFDLELESMTPYFYMGSSNIESPIPINFEDNQTDKSRHFQLGTDYYFSINYDPYRKEFWRVFFKRYDEESITKILKRESGRSNQQFFLVYDENLKKIGEFEIDEELNMNAYDLLFLENGALISATPDSIEDEVIFRRLIIK